MDTENVYNISIYNFLLFYSMFFFIKDNPWHRAGHCENDLTGILNYYIVLNVYDVIGVSFLYNHL